MRKVAVALLVAAAAAYAYPAAAKSKGHQQPAQPAQSAAPAAEAARPAPASNPSTPQPPGIEARGYILVDAESGLVLAEEKPDERMEPASLTKLMTAYALFAELKAGHVHLTDMVHISETAWRTSGSRMFVQVNTDVQLEHLVQGMIVQSGNDASVAIAEFLAGGEDAFAEVMNKHAAKLGMTGSHFMNSTGLPHPQHYSTPRDMAKLAAAIIQSFPEYYKWYSEKEFSYNNITQPNRNRLLWIDPSVDGMKTGFTEAAGYCLVSSAKREGMRLVSVMMGTKSANARVQESKKLLDWGFRFYESRQVYPANTPLKTQRVWKGEAKEVALGLTEPVAITLPRGQLQKVTASMSAENLITAPVQQGQKLGTVRVQLGDKVLVERPVVALQPVPEGGIFTRMVDSVMLMFQ